MTSSIFSSSPLLVDLYQRPWAFLAVGGKVLLFALLLWAFDRAGDAWLRKGLESYFRIGTDSDVLCVGHSRMVLGLDPLLLADVLNLKVAKYAVEGANARDRLAMIRHYLQRAKRPPKLVLYDVSGYTFDDTGLSSNSYRLFRPFMDDLAMAWYVRDCAPTTTEIWLCRLFHLHRYNEATLSLAIRGHFGIHENLKDDAIDLAIVRRRIETGRVQHHRIDPGAEKIVEATIDDLHDRQVQLILVYVPTMDLLNNVDRAAHDKIIDRLQHLADKHSNVHFLDYNKEFESRHELFLDGIHLNRSGQQIVTRRLAQDLAGMLHRDAHLSAASGSHGNSVVPMN